MLLHLQGLTSGEVNCLVCCFESSSLGLLVGTEAAVMTSDSAGFSFFSLQGHTAFISLVSEQDASQADAFFVALVRGRYLGGGAP